MESKNNHVVRKYGFYYRYDSLQALKVLGQLWKVVCLRMNLFTGLSWVLFRLSGWENMDYS